MIDKYKATGHTQEEVQKFAVEQHEKYNEDVFAAVAWLKQQPFVDRNRMGVSGVSYGGIQTLLTAQKGLGLRAAGDQNAPGTPCEPGTDKTVPIRAGQALVLDLNVK